MKVIAAVLSLLAAADACYLVAHSSTVGDFKVQHSEPKDHGGAAQYVNWSYGACTITGQILDGCGVQVSSATGCGTVSFTIDHAG